MIIPQTMSDISGLIATATSVIAQTGKSEQKDSEQKDNDLPSVDIRNS